MFVFVGNVNEAGRTVQQDGLNYTFPKQQQEMEDNMESLLGSFTDRNVLIQTLSPIMSPRYFMLLTCSIVLSWMEVGFSPMFDVLMTSSFVL